MAAGQGATPAGRRPARDQPSGVGGDGRAAGMAAGPGDAGNRSRGPSHRALGVDAAQVGLEAAHAPAAVAAQLQVAVALVGALHQERDGLRLGFGLDLHVGCAVGSTALRDARQAASEPPTTSATTARVSGARAPASGAFYRHLALRLCGEGTLWPPPIGWSGGHGPNVAQSAPGFVGGRAGRARGRGLMQPVALASLGVPAAAPEPGCGGHVWVR